MKSCENSDHFQHMLSLQIKSLKLSGFWFYIPIDTKSYRFWIIAVKRFVLGTLVFVLPVVGQIIHLIRLLASEHFEIQEVAGIINLVITELLISLKLLDLSCRRNLLSELNEEMQRKEFLHFSSPQKNIVKKSVDLSKRLFKWLIGACAVDIAVHMIVVPAINDFQALPVKMDFIFFDANEQYFNIMYVYQVVCPLMFYLIAVSQLDVLIYNFENMKELVKTGNCEINEDFKDGFKKSIVHHCAIIKLVNTIGRVFGGQFLLFCILNSLIICTTAVQFISIKNTLNNIMEPVWMLGFLSIFIVILYIDCYFGSIITEKGSYISTVAYCFPWIDLALDSKKNMIIFFINNQQDLVITAPNQIPVSMATFRKVMNWTYKGFAVLNQMKQ